MKFGVGSRDLTPEGPIELAGFGYNLDRVSTRVDRPITASALAIEDRDGRRAVVCGVDLISVGRDTVESIRERLAHQLGDRQPEALLINASHTHSGPATRMLYGAGGYNANYVDGTVVPAITDAVMEAFDNVSDGDISLARGRVEGISFNRTQEASFDDRISVIDIETERMSVSGLHFACHPVVFGPRSTALTSDYPGYVRTAFRAPNFWLTGCAGDIDPKIGKAQDTVPPQKAAEDMGTALGYAAWELTKGAAIEDPLLRTYTGEVEVPVDTEFRLKIGAEVRAFCEARGIKRLSDPRPLLNWLKQVKPIVNSYESATLSVPVTLIAIGNVMLAGFGAEIYNGTGQALETAFPEYEMVTMMTTNEHEGYVPPRGEYDRGAYAARNSAFIFGRKPLTPDSEDVFRAGVTAAIEQLQAA